MKLTTTLPIFLGIFAATVAAQTTPVEETAPVIAPVEAGDGVEVAVGDFPVPTEMQKRQLKPGRLNKRHYGTFTYVASSHLIASSMDMHSVPDRACFLLPTAALHR